MTKEPPRFADQLLARLTDPDLEDHLAPGEKLPSTKELAKEYGVAAQTVFRTVARFKAMGYLEGQQGRGVFVRKIVPLEFPVDRFEHNSGRDAPDTDHGSWKAIVEAQGRAPSQDTQRASVEPAPADIRAHLGMEEHTHVVLIRQVRRVDGVPFQIADSAFPARIALDSPLMWEEDVSAQDGILAELGHPVRRKVVKMTAWPPMTPTEKRRLDVPEDAMVPVLRQVRICYDRDDMPVSVLATVAPGHLNSFVYEMKA
ncbi:GntR family transcriptional regulator [Streptomyces albus]|uniref:GntR family transcriptional regulator n=1 Tax=Streptomyces albus TaxID=1888 RepID=UPI00340D4CD4